MWENNPPIDPSLRLKQSEFSFASDSSDPFIDYVLQLFAAFSGYSFHAPRSGESESYVQVYYGNDPVRRCALRIPKLGAYEIDSVPGLPPSCDTGVFLCPGTAFPFDLFGAVRFWLTDQGNVDAPLTAYDEHDRLRPTTSVQEMLGLREIPIINAYFVLLRSYIERRLGVASRRLLPEGKQCIVVLSHDVEAPVSPFDPSQNLRLASIALRCGKPRTAAAHVLNICRGLPRTAANARREYWQFDNITKSEDRYGFRSTFFFSSVSSAEGTGLDLNYDVRAPRFRQLTEKLATNGWEVGLHLSYDARQGAHRMKIEKERLESVTRRPVRGTRHHYWHLSRPLWQTLEEHGRAGIIYDTSVGFNEEPGYRLGIAYPFHPWDPRVQRRVSTVQIPTMFMDGAFFYHQAQTVDRVILRVAALIDSLKAYNGVAAIDWHDFTSYPVSNQFRQWGEAYVEILRLLASDRSVAVQSCEQLLNALHLQ